MIKREVDSHWSPFLFFNLCLYNSVFLRFRALCAAIPVNLEHGRRLRLESHYVVMIALLVHKSNSLMRQVIQWSLESIDNSSNLCVCLSVCLSATAVSRRPPVRSDWNLPGILPGTRGCAFSRFDINRRSAAHLIDFKTFKQWKVSYLRTSTYRHSWLKEPVCCVQSNSKFVTILTWIRDRGCGSTVWKGPWLKGSKPHGRTLPSR